MAKPAAAQTESSDVNLDTIHFHGAMLIQPYGSVKRLSLKEHPGIKMTYDGSNAITIKTKSIEMIYPFNATNGCIKAK